MTKPARQTDTERKALSRPERRALHLAQTVRGGCEIAPHDDEARIRVDNDGGIAGKKATAALARGLVLRGYARIEDGRLRITQDGLRAWNAPLEPSSPVYLGRPGAIRYRVLPNNRWAVDERGDGRDDYTSNASRSIDSDWAPGAWRSCAISVAPDIERYAFDARTKERELRAEKGRTLDGMSLEQRIALACSEARSRHMDVSGDIRYIRLMVDNGRENAALSRLAALEADLGQRAA